MAPAAAWVDIHRVTFPKIELDEDLATEFRAAVCDLCEHLSTGRSVMAIVDADEDHRFFVHGLTGGIQ